jgi:DUF1680 family protein
MSIKPVPAPATAFALGGEIGRRLAAVTQQWLLPAPFANPGLLEMFRYRDRQPYANQVPWAGEFAGKYLTHAVQILRLTGDPQLRDHLAWFVSELVSLQAEDGYLGPWPQAWRLRSGAPNCSDLVWDAWGHYHAMLGLLFWHQYSGDANALACARRIGDLFCNRFLGNTGETLHGTGCQEMNLAPVHSLAWLHRLTGEPRYLELARQITGEFAIPPAGDYLRAGLANTPFWQTPKPRWESLHPIQGLAELWRTTGDDQYRRAFTSLWQSMRDGDRHNNGGFTSGEQATGNPYDRGAIETCCTVAWSAMSVDMLELSGDSRVADELELSLFNSGLGLISPSGRWVTYNTPMNGERQASAHTIVFQSRAGTPELNCCSVNGPRMLGLLAEWAVRARDGGIDLNYYGPGQITVTTPGGARLRLDQETDYPRTSGVHLRLDLTAPETFPLRLRIPAWSRETRARLNGHKLAQPVPGQYMELKRTWQAGDQVELDFDFTPHRWVNESMLTIADDWITRWRLFGLVPRRAGEMDTNLRPALQMAPALESLTEMPNRLEINGQTYDAVTAESTHGILNGKAVFPEFQGLPPSLVGFTELTVAGAQTLTVNFGPDWWISWYVNGERVFDGTGIGSFDDRPCLVRLPLRAGRNVIAFQMGGGTSRHCWLSLARGRLAGEPPSACPPHQPVSVYRGPILLAYDPRFNPGRDCPAAPPPLPAAVPELTPCEWPQWLKPWLLFRTAAADGGAVTLCDFASAGQAGGQPYTSWLPVAVPKAGPLHSDSPFATDISRPNHAVGPPPSP